MTSLLKINTAESLVLQARSKQDYAFSGISSENTFQYAGVADGHGKCINALYPTTILKKIDWASFLTQKDYFSEIIKKCSVFKTNGVGSTLSICKIYLDRFEFSWVGDSTGKLYKNGKCIFKTNDHDRNNKEENKRLSENPNVDVETHKNGTLIMDTEVKNSTNIQLVNAKIYDFHNKNRINFTHSLGHGGITGSHFSTITVPREENESYKVICATDGLWGMACDDDEAFLGSSKTSCLDIVKFANERWRQEWNFDNGVSIVKGCKFPDHNIDDIGVSTWTC